MTDQELARRGFARSFLSAYPATKFGPAAAVVIGANTTDVQVYTSIRDIAAVLLGGLVDPFALPTLRFLVDLLYVEREDEAGWVEQNAIAGGVVNDR